MKKIIRITLENYLMLFGKIENIDWNEAKAKCTYSAITYRQPSVQNYNVVKCLGIERENSQGQCIFNFELSNGIETVIRPFSPYWIELDVEFLLDEKYTK